MPQWAGFVLCVAGFASYPVFVRFPATRDVPWVNFLLFAAGLGFLVLGLCRAYFRSEQYRGKVSGPILSTLSFVALSFFCFIVFYQTRQLPASTGTPRIGQPAPEFVLLDANNRPVSLASLLTSPMETTKAPPRGVVLVFYRGYW